MVHILTASGDRLGNDELGKWDKHMRDSLGRTLNGELDDHACSNREASAGGLVWTWPSLRFWRLAWLLDLLWSLSWAVWSRRAWAILEMLLEAYDARTADALERAASSLPGDLTLKFRGMVNDAAAAASNPVETADDAGG